MNGNPFACDAKGNPHTWVEEYYGHRCADCDLFFAEGCAPWDDDQPITSSASDE